MADTLITGTTLVEKESRSIGDVPIGGVVPWLKNLTGVPNLPDGWVLCDGSVVSDNLSLLNGVTIPDLNGDNRFLRGNDTAGGEGGSETMAHTHTITTDTKLEGGGDEFDEVGNATTSGASNTENRPPFHDVVWICRTR